MIATSQYKQLLLLWQTTWAEEDLEIVSLHAATRCSWGHLLLLGTAGPVTNLGGHLTVLTLFQILVELEIYTDDTLTKYKAIIFVLCLKITDGKKWTLCSLLKKICKYTNLYRAYTKEWCGFYIVNYLKRTINFFIPFIF
jgi:hypothetical protein